MSNIIHNVYVIYFSKKMAQYLHFQINKRATIGMKIYHKVDDVELIRHYNIIIITAIMDCDPYYAYSYTCHSQ